MKQFRQGHTASPSRYSIRRINRILVASLIIIELILVPIVFVTTVTGALPVWGHRTLLSSVSSQEEVEKILFSSNMSRGTVLAFEGLVSETQRQETQRQASLGAHTLVGIGEWGRVSISKIRVRIDQYQTTSNGQGWSRIYYDVVLRVYCDLFTLVKCLPLIIGVIMFLNYLAFARVRQGSQSCIECGYPLKGLSVSRW